MALPSSSAIFSPSVARQAALAARDWSNVDGWLLSKFGGRLPPSFERNTDTLRALFVLASFNEAADDARDALHQAEDTIQMPQPSSWAPSSSSGLDHVGATILEVVDQYMPSDIATALNAVAAAAVRLGIMTSADPECIASRLIKLRTQVLEQEHLRARLDMVKENVDYKANYAIQTLDTLGSNAFKLTSEVVEENLNLQRRIKSLTARLGDRNELARSGDIEPSLDVNFIVSREKEYRKHEIERNRLDRDLAPFRGLSFNLEVARADLENRMHDLQVLVERRDIVFEGLVEAESPVKRRS